MDNDNTNTICYKKLHSMNTQIGTYLTKINKTTSSTLISL